MSTTQYSFLAKYWIKIIAIHLILYHKTVQKEKMTPPITINVIQNTINHHQFGLNWHPSRQNEVVSRQIVVIKRDEHKSTEKGKMSKSTIVAGDIHTKPLTIKETRLKHVAEKSRRTEKQKKKNKNKNRKTTGAEIYYLKQLIHLEVEPLQKEAIKRQIKLLTNKIKGRKYAVEAVQEQRQQQQKAT